MPPVRIEAEAWCDQRFPHLASVLGLGDGHYSIIKVAIIWAWQTEHYTPEAPCFVVPTRVIEMALGDAGPAAMVRVGLAEETPDGYRICGSNHERTGWLYRIRCRSAKGGAEKSKRSKKSEQDNKVVPVASHRLATGEPQESPLSSLLSVQREEEQRPAAPPALVLAVQEPRPQKPPGKSAQPANEQKPVGDHPRVIAAFWAAFEAATGAKPTWKDSIGENARILLKSQTAEEIIRRIGNFFARPRGSWPEDRDWGTFVAHFDKWAIASVPAHQAEPRRSKKL